MVGPVEPEAAPSDDVDMTGTDARATTALPGLCDLMIARWTFGLRARSPSSTRKIRGAAMDVSATANAVAQTAQDVFRMTLPHPVLSGTVQEAGSNAASDKAHAFT